MDFANYRNMDPAVLYSFINSRLRDGGETLEELLEDQGISPEDFIAHMENHGYTYHEEIRQFR